MQFCPAAEWVFCGTPKGRPAILIQTSLHFPRFLLSLGRVPGYTRIFFQYTAAIPVDEVLSEVTEAPKLFSEGRVWGGGLRSESRPNLSLSLNWGFRCFLSAPQTCETPLTAAMDFFLYNIFNSLCTSHPATERFVAWASYVSRQKCNKIIRFIRCRNFHLLVEGMTRVSRVDIPKW